MGLILLIYLVSHISHIIAIFLWFIWSHFNARAGMFNKTYISALSTPVERFKMFWYGSELFRNICIHATWILVVLNHALQNDKIMITSLYLKRKLLFISCRILISRCNTPIASSVFIYVHIASPPPYQQHRSAWLVARDLVFTPKRMVPTRNMSSMIYYKSKAYASDL